VADTTQSEFNNLLKRMSKVYLKLIISSIGLKYRYEKVLWLFYVEEKSHVEIAEEMNLTKESIDNLITKARKQLKYLLDTQGVLLSPELQQYLDILKTN
jgi:DNA-directed RNA polymerase specialized sigma24 family protein